MKKDHRGSWYLLTGIVLGVILGLVYSWEISPVKYVDAPPSALRADYKDDYRLLVALAFASNHDLLRAESRLAQLKDDQIIQSLTIQAERTLAEGGPQVDVQALTSLSDALGGSVTPASPGEGSDNLSEPSPDTTQESTAPSTLDSTTAISSSFQITPTNAITLPLPSVMP